MNEWRLIFFHYEQFWYQDWIWSHSCRGNIKKHRVIEFHSKSILQTILHFRTNIYPSIRFIILVSYIESKKIVNASKNPSSLIDFLPDVPGKYIKCSSLCTFSLPGGYDCKKKKNYLFKNAKKILTSNSLSFEYIDNACCLLVSYFLRVKLL